jgi:hypothetical protein
MTNVYRIFIVRPQGMISLGRIGYRWEDNIRMDGGRGVESSGVEQGPVAGSCECSNEPSGTIKDGEFLDQVNDCLFLKKDSDPWS